MKIAFLFLTIGDVNFPEIWEKFFETTSKNNYSIYCHPKNPEDLTINWMKNNIIKNLVKTEWGHFTNAYVELLKSALENDENTHFIFVSESCIPIKSFCNIQIFISKYNINCSFIHLEESDNYNFKKSKLKENYFYKFKESELIKHSGWFCLSRKHATELVNHPDVYKFNRIIAGDEHILSLIYWKNKKYFINYKMTYANWNYSKKKVEMINKKLKELYEFQEKTGESKEKEIFELKKEKSNFGKHPKTYRKITKKTFKKILNSKSFFFRKFSKDSSINKYYMKLFKEC